MTIDKARRRQVVARWHRRFAVFISLWLVVLAASGTLVNHAHDWGLDQKPLSAPIQRFVYGFEPAGEDFCSGVVTPEFDCAGVFARLPLPASALLLGRDSLFLLDSSGQLVEKLAANHLGLGELEAGFSDGSQVYLRDGQKTILSDENLMDTMVLDPQAATALSSRNWQVRGEVTEAITWERFLLDIHAARFLGPLAKAFNDLVAGLILVLALSGVWLYRLKRKPNGNGSAGLDQ
jgi:uncharacterized iron-regulated membrane protein